VLCNEWWALTLCPLRARLYRSGRNSRGTAWRLRHLLLRCRILLFALAVMPFLLCCLSRACHNAALHDSRTRHWIRPLQAQHTWKAFETMHSGLDVFVVICCCFDAVEDTSSNTGEGSERPSTWRSKHENCARRFQQAPQGFQQYRVLIFQVHYICSDYPIKRPYSLKAFAPKKASCCHLFCREGIGVQSNVLFQQ